MTTNATETIILYLLLLLGGLFTVIATVRARKVALRSIEAYRVMPLAVGETVESDKVLHVSLGSSAVGEESTITALASAHILYYVAERAAVGDRATLVTVSDAVTLGVAQNTLRQAYKSRGMGKRFHPSFARWYPQGPLSLAFAAGVGTAIRDEDALTNVLIGRFGPEMMLLAESAVRGDRRIIAQSDRIEGQAVAYALTDTPLIGEELYVGNAYLGGTPTAVGGVVALDVLRYLTIGGIILAALLGFLTRGR